MKIDEAKPNEVEKRLNVRCVGMKNKKLTIFPQQNKSLTHRIELFTGISGGGGVSESTQQSINN